MESAKANPAVDPGGELAKHDLTTRDSSCSSCPSCMFHESLVRQIVQELKEWANEIESCAEGSHAGINATIQAMRNSADRLASSVSDVREGTQAPPTAPEPPQ